MNSIEGNEDFQISDSSRSNSLSYSVPADSLWINDYILLEGQPCRIIRKRGFTLEDIRRRVRYIGINLFTGRKMCECFFTDKTIQVPTIQYKEYHLVNMIGNTLSLMADSGQLIENIYVPETKHASALKHDFDSGKKLFVTTVCAMDEEGFIAYKEAALDLEAQSIPSCVQDDEQKG